MRVQHDADTARELLEESDLKVGEGAHRRKLDDRLHFALEQNRQHDHIARNDLEECRTDRNRVRGHLIDQQPPLVERALTNQALADPKPLRMAVRTVIGIGRQQPEPEDWRRPRPDR